MNPLRRFARFNVVGALGIGVQLGTLAALLAAGVHYTPATAAAVAAALAHNFVWHARWTWRDRAPRGAAGIAAAFLKFVCLNGAVSMIGNLILMPLLVGRLGLTPLIANPIAIAACGVANFLGGRACFPQLSTDRGQASQASQAV